ncbi:hypothetical protein G4177_06535 [Corallococcus sp. ZKHCc1 1396]|uniref:Uncharacterized protein n=1 Tax=Corallococcus soli TaxID=2710757 RepID=A0ABR9PIX7_9BACT|nr:MULTISPECIES: hypothetical protein [Corallococcus]MBE4747835.1 hypothetical protein [Corallococcus soli]MCY1031031.1 hypothetical protein [Corallococcus sp. BB11-1]
MRTATKQAPMNLQNLNPSGHGIEASSHPSPGTAPFTCRWRDFASYRLASPGS